MGRPLASRPDDRGQHDAESGRAGAKRRRQRRHAIRRAALAGQILVAAAAQDAQRARQVERVRDRAGRVVQRAGGVAFAWQSLSAGGNGYLVGYAAGGASLDVGPLDISAALPLGFATGAADSLGLVEAADLPRLNSVMNVTGTGYPLGSLIGFVGIGSAAFEPGIDLAPFGAAGCRAYTSPDLSMLVFVQGGQSTLPLYVPQDPAFLGAALHSQTFALAPAANLLGITTSNAVRHVFGY
jgi:hypothetical protein